MDFVFLGLIFCVILPTVLNKAILEVRFVRYINHAGTGENGHCCDGRGFFCFSKCDHRFVICLDEADNNRDVNRCLIGRKSSGAIDNANVNIFADAFGGVRNPMIFYLDIWKEKAQLKVDVFDVDDNSDDKVDFLYGNFTLSAAKTKKLSRDQSFRLATPRTLLDYKVSVYCEENYYGTGCDVMCEERNDVTGHYTCDMKTGAKVCMEGWEGDNCDKQPEEMCGTQRCGHNQICNNATSEYTCGCIKGFTGDNCTEPVLTECSDGYCHNNGSCHVTNNTLTCNCTIGWRGDRCAEEYDPCEFNPCQRNGTCIPKDKEGYMCLCPIDSQGLHCENISVCLTQENVCLNGGKCIQENYKEDWYFCDCPVHYIGKHCETLVKNVTNVENVTDNVNVTQTVTTTPVPTSTVTEAPKAVVVLRGKVDNRNEEEVRKALMKIIHDFTNIKGTLTLDIEKDVFKTEEGEILTEIGVRGTSDGEPFNVGELQRVLSDSHASMVDSYLPIPRNLPDSHTHTPLPNASQKQIQHDGWIHHYWFVVLLAVLAIVALVMFVIGFIIIRKKKSLEEMDNKANVARSSTNVTDSNTSNAQSFENSLYFEMNNQKQGSGKVNFKAMP
ncbi:neurogenic locus protein delta-like [Saccostrea cucullata]|uniref:neurogenic locus protein delta-like n=1 Tax=Saccostrea cuccullata TaxID=36930 RepID=UPI002ED4CB36